MTLNGTDQKKSDIYVAFVTEISYIIIYNIKNTGVYFELR
jgi:hypothetical protein